MTAYAREDMEWIEHTSIAGGSENMNNHFGNQDADFLENGEST